MRISQASSKNCASKEPRRESTSGGTRALQARTARGQCKEQGKDTYSASQGESDGVWKDRSPFENLCN
jgi:hypothetical protein